jgi:hypothetical protein
VVCQSHILCKQIAHLQGEDQIRHLCILCIKYKMNINSKDFITIKQPPVSPRIELEDPS